MRTEYTSDGPTDRLEKSSSKFASNSNNFHNWDPQEIGLTRSHWQEFKKMRNQRMDFYAAETNKLIIRLDKIISELPVEPSKRREHEQKVVHWVNDEDVKLCPQCAKSFNLLRRKHHCRVCGTIQCHPCSQFLLLSFARKLTNPSYVAPSAEEERSVQGVDLDGLAYTAFRVLKRTGSATSLTSLIDSHTGEGHIRVCSYCKQLLERREQQIDFHSQKTTIVELYNEMRLHMDKGTQLMPIFLKMVASFSQGESTYNLKDAQECRLRLLKIAEFVDGYSKKVQGLGMNDEKNAPTGAAYSLQQKIRLSAVHFLKENLLGLPNLPDAGQLAKLQEERRQAIEKRIIQEKLAISERREFELKRQAQFHSKEQESVSVDRGWGVETSRIKVANEDDDPMLQQMQIINNYIQQARRDHRYDEVAMLEANLRELQFEHNRTLSNTS